MNRTVLIGLAACSAAVVMATTQTVRRPAAPPKPLGPYDVSPLETEVLGQSRWLKGGPASLRVIVSDHATEKPLRANVKIALAALNDGKPATPVAVYSGRTNDVGTLDAQFRAPATAPGTYELRVSVDSPIGQDEVKQPIQLEESQQILLTADKPVYQPGQTIHLRALALDMANRTPIADQALTFEVEDARGNKVFKNKQTLSKFGIGSADFALADEVNMGTFTLRAVLASGLAEKKVRVERYVLPKFKVAVTTERPYYLPGELVKGTVQADYFFGKPVAKSEVVIQVNTVDIGVTKLAELRGTTDEAGAYKFEYNLPNTFVGQPFEQGKAVAEFQARVTDGAEHLQMQSKSVPVVKDPIQIALVPESRQLVPALPNRVYVACATADGAPLKNADLAVTTSEDPAAVHLTTDSMGMATYQFTPKTTQVTVTAQATSADGHSASASQALSGVPTKEGILLRTDKTLAKVGERLNLLAISTSKAGTVYVDVIRNKQTILTRAEPSKAGQASVNLNLTNDMVGTLEVHAYKILPDENIIRDTKTIVVAPADDLVVQVTPDKAEYRPGEDALLRFAVRNKANQPVASAIGLAIVDESVFALSELQPGLEKVYFMLERELMEPKYEIHGLKPSDMMLKEREPGVTEPQRQRAAALLLAAAPASQEFDYRANTWLTRFVAVREKAAEFISTAQQKLQQCSQKYRQDTGNSLTGDQGLQPLVDRGYVPPKELLDPWGRSYKLELYGQTGAISYFALSSAGPDGKWGTVDDILNVQQYYRNRSAGRAMGGFGGGLGAGGFGGGRGDLLEADAKARFDDRFGVVNGPMGGAQPLFMAKADAIDLASAVRRDVAKDKREAGPGAAEPRLRQFFPETMYWNPAIITDANGRAEVRVPVADSITTWRMSMLANGAHGELGSATAPLKVFQDFFADIDLPISLTQNDRVEIPVAVYNYLPGDQDVTLKLDEQPWFSLEGPATQTVHMGRNQVKVVRYPITVKTLGNHALKVTARGTKLSDALMRSIDVTPDGKEVRGAINDTLIKEAEKTVIFPEGAIPGASGLWVKLYPGAFSQVVEGLDGLLRMPNGCFEQTSSTTYPNVLVTDYLKTTKKINPELQMKAEQYINVGYQRLVTFECKGGGFSWFGTEPANQILTAYGLLEFSDMAKVHDVDPALLQRTQRWLAGRQQADGTWPKDDGGIAEGIINRQTDALRSSAYIAWALAESSMGGPAGFGGQNGVQTSGILSPAVPKAVAYVKEHRAEAKDPYTLALILNLLVKTERDSETTADAAEKLIRIAKTTEKAAWWEGDTQTFTGASQGSADLETTGLAAYGLAKWGRNAGFTNKVLTYLVQSKDSYGTWQTTQGTVWSMKALLYASTNGAGGGKGTVTVWANGAKAATIPITAEDSDVMRQVDLKELMKAGKNDVKLSYAGEGSLLYQIASRCYVPWENGPKAGPSGPLSIDVAYDKTTLAENDTANVTVTVKNNTNRVAEMPLIDLGIPPGFTVVPDELEAAVREKRISKYTLAQRQIIVYLEKLDPASTLKLTYQVKAKYPIKARIPISKAYPYYNPEKVGTSKPAMIVVR
jgi:hypothetical protein